MDWGYVGAVVVSGLVIVFVALILLIFMVWLMGKFFRFIREQDKPAESGKTVQQTPLQTAEPVPAAASEEEEVVAVIAAAVAAMSEESGVPLRIKSIKPARSGSGSGRGAWQAAAAREATRTF